MNSTKYFITSLVIILLLSSCLLPVPVTTVNSEERTVAINYDFVPPTKNTDEVDISFILLKPKYAEAFDGESQRLYTLFIDNMEDDFEEMLVAKGYSIRGPYSTYDEIVFSDKTETDLLLETEIDFNFEWSVGALKVKRGYQGAYVKNSDKYHIDGRIDLGGKVNLVIKESLTQEKLWIRSISLENKSLTIKTPEYEANSVQEATNYLMEDYSFKNPMYNALNDYYQRSLQMAWNHLDPNELEGLKLQVEALRKKKGY